MVFRWADLNKVLHIQDAIPSVIEPICELVSLFGIGQLRVASFNFVFQDEVLCECLNDGGFIDHKKGVIG